MDKGKLGDFFFHPPYVTPASYGQHGWVLLAAPCFPSYTKGHNAGSWHSVHMDVLNSVRSCSHWKIEMAQPNHETAAFTPMWPVAGTRQCRSQLVNANVSGEIGINRSSLSPVDWKCHKNTVRLSCWSLKVSTNERNNGLLIHLSQVWHPCDTIYNCIDVFQALVREIFDKENNHETSWVLG